MPILLENVSSIISILFLGQFLPWDGYQNAKKRLANESKSV